MKKIYISSFVLLASLSGFTQYKNDNVLYKTVFPQDLCSSLQQAKDYLLLDVRSKGEYEDTSSSPIYNLGHIKNAINIDVSDLGKKLSEIDAFKTRPVYVYCSHSQRSRKASKLLADSGFTNIININGGVTAIRQLPEENCIYNSLVSKVGYNIISVSTLCKKLSAGNSKTFILDVRSDSAWRRIDLNAKVNSFGHIKNSMNIPFTDLKKRLAEIPVDKDVIIVDLFGNDAARAATLLHDNNYKNVSILLEGLDRLNYFESKNLSCMNDYYASPVKYKIMSCPDFKRFSEKNTDYLALDIRSLEEFTNKHKDYWRNVGHLSGAVNIPLADLANKLTGIEKYRNKTVVIYAFSGGKEAHEAANILVSNGFTNVQVLAGGLFNIRWTANNIPGNASLAKLVLDIPAENL